MVSAAPPERAGAAAGISETSSEFGGTVGIAVLGVVGTAVYRDEVADAVPAGVPPDAAQAARDTLGGAVAAGDQLPDPFGPGLVDAASDAFTQALQLAASLSAAVVIAATVLAWALLRRVEAGPKADDQRGLEVHRAVPDRTPCWQTRSRIAEVPDEAGG
jgi:DHA2 family multidrug resistance protein-like MFS transporter